MTQIGYSKKKIFEKKVRICWFAIYCPRLTLSIGGVRRTSSDVISTELHCVPFGSYSERYFIEALSPTQGPDQIANLPNSSVIGKTKMQHRQTHTHKTNNRNQKAVIVSHWPQF